MPKEKKKERRNRVWILMSEAGCSSSQLRLGSWSKILQRKRGIIWVSGVDTVNLRTRVPSFFLFFFLISKNLARERTPRSQTSNRHISFIHHTSSLLLCRAAARASASAAAESLTPLFFSFPLFNKYFLVFHVWTLIGSSLSLSYISINFDGKKNKKKKMLCDHTFIFTHRPSIFCMNFLLLFFKKKKFWRKICMNLGLLK